MWRVGGIGLSRGGARGWGYGALGRGRSGGVDREVWRAGCGEQVYLVVGQVRRVVQVWWVGMVEGTVLGVWYGSGV